MCVRACACVCVCVCVCVWDGSGSKTQGEMSSSLHPSGIMATLQGS